MTNLERKVQDETFLFLTFFTISPIRVLKCYSKFCDDILSVKTRARKAKITIPCCGRSPDNNTPKRSAAGVAGALFRYINI